MQTPLYHLQSLQECLAIISERTDSHSPSPLRKQNKNRKDILCKIAFEIDGEEEELLIEQNATLETVTDELIMKLNFASLARDESEFDISEQQRTALEGEIKSKIQIILQSCISKTPKTQQWKKKLKKLIERQPQGPAYNFLKELSFNEQNRGRNNNVKYFGYNAVQVQDCQRYFLTSQAELKNISILRRAKMIENSLGKQTNKATDNIQIKNRLYDLSKQQDAIKQQLSKIREEHLQEQQLSQCTFQPNRSKIKLKTQTSQPSKHSTLRHKNCVFNRLYNQALQKQQKMKVIEQQLNQRQKQEYTHLNFIPSINSCSREIVNLKKEASKHNVSSIYDHLYNETFRKDKKKIQNECSFQPKLCPKSQKMVKKAKTTRHYNQENFPLQTQQGSFDKCHFQSEAQTKRLQTRNTLSKDKSPSFLKNFKYLYNDSTSPLSKKRNILREIKNSHSQNRSFRVTHNNSNNSSLERRVQTCQSQHIFQKSGLRLNKNIIDPSSFGQQTCENSDSIKKTRQNLYFLAGKTHPQFNRSETNTSITERGNKNPKQKDGQLSKKKQKKSKPVLSPYDFFKEEEKKQNKTNRSRLETVSTHEQLSERKIEVGQTTVFETIFNFFNTNNEEQIKADFIDENPAIPSALYNVFYPMSEEMKQLNVGLDREEFVWSLTRIYQTLNQQQRKQIVSWSMSLKQPKCFRQNKF